MAHILIPYPNLGAPRLASETWAGAPSIFTTQARLPFIPPSVILDSPMETLNPTRLAELGRKLYEERFKDEYSPAHIGEILAIDVESSTAYLGKTPLEALTIAKAANRNGHFHLIKLGSAGVYTLRPATADSHARQL